MGVTYTPPAAAGGASDHGALTGLADADHAAYLELAGGTLTGALDAGNQQINNAFISGGSTSAANNQIQFRAGTAAEWTSDNPVLAINEKGVESDTGKYKFGDGSTAWTSLGYAGSFSRANHTGSQAASTVSDLATVVKAYRLDEFAAPTAARTMNGQKHTGLAAGTTAGDGLRYEQVVGLYLLLAGGTMAGTLAMNGQTLSNPVIGPYREPRSTLTSATSVNLDLSVANVFTLVPTHDVTITTSNIPAGTVSTAWVVAVNNGGTARTFAYPAAWKWPTTQTPPTTIAANTTYLISALTNDNGTTVRAAVARYV